jgi:hypothetical protein
MIQPIAFKTYLYLMPMPAIGTPNTKVNFESIQALEGADIYGLQLISNTSVLPYGNGQPVSVFAGIYMSLTLVRGNTEIVKNHPLNDFNNDLYGYTPNGGFYQLPIRMYTPQKFDLTKSYVTIHGNVALPDTYAMINFIYK